jgi:hypothetical protein
MIGFENISRTIENLNTGNIYGTEAYMTSIADSKNFFGEKKKLEFVYTSTEELGGYNLFINMALFMPVNAINPITKRGTVYWECALPEALAPGVYPCNLNSTAAIYNFIAFKNFSMEVEIIDDTTFIIRSEFYLTMDLLRYMDSFMGINNRDRFFKDRMNNPDDISESTGSIYGGANADGRVYIYAEFAGDSGDFGSIETEFGGFTAEYLDAGGSITDVEYSVDSQVTDTIVVDKSTKIRMIIDCPVFTLESAWVLVFKHNKTDNTIDFIENYQSETLYIFPYAPDGNIITGPYQEPQPEALIGPDAYSIEFYVNGLNIEAGEEVGFIVMGYDAGGENGGVFYSKVGPGKGGLEFNGEGFTMMGRLSDCESEYTGDNLTCTIEERMASEMIIQFPFDQYKNDILNRMGLVITNNITTFLTKVKFTIYENTTLPFPFFGAVKNVLDERTLTKVNGQYVGGNITMTNIPDQMNLKAFWRNRWEENINCVYSLINSINYGSFETNQDWGGKTLTIEWELTFFYDTLITPFTDIVRYDQQIFVRDYSPLVEIHTQDPDQDDLNYLCSNENICLYAQFVEPPGDNYKLITFIDNNPGSILTIEENEVWSPAEFGPLVSNKFASQEENFGDSTANQAKFCLVSSLLTDNVTYKVSTIAKFIP